MSSTWPLDCIAKSLLLKIAINFVKLVVSSILSSVCTYDITFLFVQLTEVGTMNIFVHWINENGGVSLSILQVT